MQSLLKKVIRFLLRDYMLAGIVTSLIAILTLFYPLNILFNPFENSIHKIYSSCTYSQKAVVPGQKISNKTLPQSNEISDHSKIYGKIRKPVNGFIAFFLLVILSSLFSFCAMNLKVRANLFILVPSLLFYYFSGFSAIVLSNIGLIKLCGLYFSTSPFLISLTLNFFILIAANYIKPFKKSKLGAKVVNDQALRESKDYLKTVLNSVPTGILLINPDNRIIIDTNKFFCTMLESKKNFINNTLLDAHFINEIPLDKIPKKGHINTYENQLRGPNPIPIPVLVTMQRITKDGRRYCFINVVDNTEQSMARLKLEETNYKLNTALEELKKTQGKLIEAEKLGALGQMADGLAHDLNNILLPVSVYSDLLLRSVDENDEESADILSTIKSSGKRATDLVQRLRSFAKPRSDEDHFDEIDLNKLIDETVILTKPKWRQLAVVNSEDKIDLKVNLNLSPEAADIEADEGQLSELLVNLIFNAADAMPDGGEISIGTFVGDNNDIVIEVQDTGVGMSDLTQKHCLDPYYTTKGDKGTGMGLSMVFGIVQRHSGKIEIKSEEGVGTLFKITLPRKQN